MDELTRKYSDDGSISVSSTESQREVWAASRFGVSGSLAHNSGWSLSLNGDLDERALRNALQTILDRHEALRSHFTSDGRVLVIDPEHTLELPVHDLSGLEDADRAAVLSELGAQEMELWFDLAQGPLVRFTLAKLGAARHRLLLVAHQSVCDGWSAHVVFRELGALYSAFTENRDGTLPLAPRYADYCTINHHYRRSRPGRTDETYWVDQLRDGPKPPQLPNERSSRRIRKGAARVRKRLRPALARELRARFGGNRSSLDAAILTAFASLVHRLTNQSDMVVGVTAAGQQFYNVPGLVGHCVNLLPLRLRVEGTASFTDSLKTTRSALLDAYDHQGVTFGTLLPQLELTRDGNRPPLVSVVFNIDVRDDDIQHTGLTVDYETLVRQAETFELFINVVDKGDSVILEASYQTALYSADLINRYLATFEALLRSACETPDRAIDELSMGEVKSDSAPV